VKTHRHVPMFAAVAAANAATDPSAPHGSDAFHRWYLDTEVPHSAAAPGGGWGGHQSLLHQLSVPVDVLLDDVLPNVPDTPVGRAWAACVRECLGRTQADVVRPFDYIEYTTTEEHEALHALDTYAEAVEETSPLLSDVADVVSRMTLTSTADPRRVELDALARERSRLTDDGLMLGTFDEDYCKDDDAYCYHLDNARLVQWAHLDALMPGFEATLRRLLAVLDADLPEVAESDGGAARGRRFESMRDDALAFLP
jgi:hypothetical protein